MAGVNELVAPIVGVLGVVVGVFLQGFWSRKNQKAHNLKGLQNQAYSDFLNAVSTIAVAQRKGQRETVEGELSSLADAKSRICVYGDANVVQHLAEFLRSGATLQTESELLAFSRLCLEMRKSVGMQDKQLYSKDISQLLFDVDVKDTETPN